MVRVMSVLQSRGMASVAQASTIGTALRIGFRQCGHTGGCAASAAVTQTTHRD